MKYELYKEDGEGLFRIRALHDFETPYSHVKTGELGGYVVDTKNLSQEGNCWIYPNGRVYGGAMVSDNAVVGLPNAHWNDKVDVSGNAKVIEDACIFNGDICGNAVVSGDAEVRSCKSISGDVVVCDNAILNNNEIALSGKGTIGGDITMFDPVSWSNFGNVYSEEDIITLSNIHLMQIYLLSGKAVSSFHFNKRDGIVFGRFLDHSLSLDALWEWSEDKSIDKTLNKGVYEKDAPVLKAMHALFNALFIGL